MKKLIVKNIDTYINNVEGTISEKGPRALRAFHMLVGIVDVITERMAFGQSSE